MSAVAIINFFTSIGDGLLLFLLIYKYLGLISPLKMILSGVTTGIFIDMTYGVFQPYALPDSIVCVGFLLAVGWVVLLLTQPGVRFRDYLFIFSVGYFSNIGALVFALFIGVAFGTSLTAFFQEYPAYYFMIDLLQYITFLAAGLYIVLKRDKILFISSIENFMYCSITLGAIFFSTFFLSLTMAIDHSVSHIGYAGVFGANSNLQPLLTFLMIFLMFCSFPVLSRYTFRCEILRSRLQEQELLNEHLASKIETLRPLHHGIRNRFAVIHALAASHSSEALAEYIEACSDDYELKEDFPFISTAGE